MDAAKARLIASSIDSLVWYFGTAITELPNPFQAGVVFPLTDSSPKPGIIIDDILMRRIQITAQLYSKIVETSSNRDSKDISFLGSLVDHDLSNIYLLLVALQPAFANSPEGLNNYKILNVFFKHLAQYRLLGLAGAYIACNGNNKLQETVPAANLEFLLSGVSKHAISACVEDGNVQTPEVAALYQIVKNARSDFILSYHGEGNCARFRFQDEGSGIRDEEGKPMPAERLHEIFGTFSTRKSGGLGLQLVKRLLELRRGNIEVISSPTDGPAIEYGTLTNMSRIILEPEFRGTRFTLYFPKTV